MREAFEIKVLWELPESHTSAARDDLEWCRTLETTPGDLLKKLFSFPVPPCPECTLDPWVVLATIALPQKRDQAAGSKDAISDLKISISGSARTVVNATVADGNTVRAWLTGGNVLHGTSAQNLPRPARRNDLERADGGKAQQRGVAGDEQVGPAGERFTKGGNSGHPESPHFFDQAEDYANGNLRPVYFYPQDLNGHVERAHQTGLCADLTITTAAIGKRLGSPALTLRPTSTAMA